MSTVEDIFSAESLRGILKDILQVALMHADAMESMAGPWLLAAKVTLCLSEAGLSGKTGREDKVDGLQHELSALVSTTLDQSL